MTSRIAPLAPNGTFELRAAVGIATSAAVREVWAARWIAMLVLVLSASLVVTLRPITDPDIWWHLRTGQWIVEHRAVPVTDPFSGYGAGSPWVAYSWLFAVLIYGLHQALGHHGLLLYPLIGGLLVTSALMALVMRFEWRPPRAIALTALGLGAMAPVLMPRAYLFTVCFFIVELYVLLAVRETGRTRPLWILPAVFAVWANVHIQFVYGLAVLGLAVAESLIVRFVPSDRIARESVPLRPVLLTSGACALATLATPYGVEIYRPVIEIGSNRAVYDLIIELGAPAFRQPANWVFLLVALAAAFTVGRHRQLQVLPVALLAGGAYLSFATARDMWFLVIVSVAIIAMTWGDRRRPRPGLPWKSAVIGAVALLVPVLGLAIHRDLSETNLEAEVAKMYPVAAVEFVKERGYSGPLYNTFDWGGFLIWRLPQRPVSMDGRSNIHGDERVVRSYLTSLGHKGWDTDEDLRSARLVVLPAGLALTALLSRSPLYDVAYIDDVAAVFTRRDGGGDSASSPGGDTRQPVTTEGKRP
jgi:hypothetical protein